MTQFRFIKSIHKKWRCPIKDVDNYSLHFEVIKLNEKIVWYEIDQLLALANSLTQAKYLDSNVMNKLKGKHQAWAPIEAVELIEDDPIKQAFRTIEKELRPNTNAKKKMKLSEYLSSGKMLHRKAKLKKAIKLDNGEKRKKGDTVSIVMEFEDGTFHAEDNDWACKITKEEFTYL